MHFDWFFYVLIMIYWRKKRIGDITIKKFSFFVRYSKINRFQGAVALYSYKSQKTSKCTKNISDTLNCP